MPHWPPDTAVCERQDLTRAPYLIGYARVSKGDEQSNAAQRRALPPGGPVTGDYRFEGEAGLRGVLGETVIQFPVADAKTPAESLARAETYIKAFKGDDLITPAVAPHSMYTLDADTLKATAALGRKYDVPVLIHAGDEHLLDDPKSGLNDELALAFVEVGFRVAGEAVGQTLEQQRLLAFEHELLVAQGAHGEPCEHEARHKHREDEEQRDAFHGSGKASRRSGRESSAASAGDRPSANGCREFVTQQQGARARRGGRLRHQRVGERAQQRADGHFVALGASRRGPERTDHPLRAHFGDSGARTGGRAQHSFLLHQVLALAQFHDGVRFVLGDGAGSQMSLRRTIGEHGHANHFLLAGVAVSDRLGFQRDQVRANHSVAGAG